LDAADQLLLYGHGGCLLPIFGVGFTVWRNQYPKRLAASFMCSVTRTWKGQRVSQKQQERQSEAWAERSA
jgi:hypothetical protein